MTEIQETEPSNAERTPPADREGPYHYSVVDRMERNGVERVQLGVRMDKRMVKVLKGLAEFDGVSLGQLLENIVLHSFEPMPGEEGEWSASPHGKKQIAAINDLKRIYGMEDTSH